ncbi:MAG: RNA-binding protein [Candidatus Aramenus sp.]|jgi:PUA domain protein|nr:RNA-binding protein [Candidatus Aramenus sp.]
MQRHFLSQKELKSFKSLVKQKYSVEIESDNVEVGREKKQVYYFIDGKLSFFSEELVPTLCWVMDAKANLPFVVVDEGAVKALSRGADLFAPGIVSYNCECKPNDIILARITTGMPVAVMKVLISKEEAVTTKRGKFAQNLHWIGDDIWKICRGQK